VGQSGVPYHEIAGKPTDESANFENGESGEHLGGFCGQQSEQFIDGCGLR
jgi:hypothetical protein